MSKRPAKPRKLTLQDRALWQVVADGVTPMVNHARVTGQEDLGIELDAFEAHMRASGANPQATRPAQEPSALQPKAGPAKTTKAADHRTAPSPPARKAPAGSGRQMADFDEKVARRLRRGQEAIDARLDLHGMRQDEAHHALRGFLNGAVGRGYRNVLVITGKGRTAAGEGGPYQTAERGVLKRMVPVWLAAPDLRNVVLSFTAAHDRHGGDGALYVRLRARRKATG